MKDNSTHFPMLVNLQGRKCLVAGAGKVAEAKIAGLLRCGARVQVVSPRATARIQSLAAAGAIVWRRQRFSPRDVEGAFLAVAATRSSQINGAVFRACAARGILCNAVDDPRHCDFFYPAVVRRGPLQIAISTGGCSPALASRLRRELERRYGPEWVPWVKELGRRRNRLLAENLPAPERKQKLLSMVTPQAFRAFQRRRRRPAHGA
jgi:precorrin-2 dehydrogenase/sirohydrochlorin ferrochelatase